MINDIQHHQPQLIVPLGSFGMMSLQLSHRMLSTYHHLFCQPYYCHHRCTAVVLHPIFSYQLTCSVIIIIRIRIIVLIIIIIIIIIIITMVKGVCRDQSMLIINTLNWRIKELKVGISHKLQTCRRHKSKVFGFEEEEKHRCETPLQRGQNF